MSMAGTSRDLRPGTGGSLILGAVLVCIAPSSTRQGARSFRAILARPGGQSGCYLARSDFPLSGAVLSSIWLSGSGSGSFLHHAHSDPRNIILLPR